MISSVSGEEESWGVHYHSSICPHSLLFYLMGLYGLSYTINLETISAPKNFNLFLGHSLDSLFNHIVMHKTRLSYTIFKKILFSMSGLLMSERREWYKNATKGNVK